MSRVLAGTIYVPDGEGSFTTVLGGTSEADAKKQASADVVAGWGDHVWAEPAADFVAESPVSVIDDKAADLAAEADDQGGSHRTRQRSGRPAGGE